MTAYYNEIEPYAAQWLRNLIAAGHIAPGDVDERSIVDVRPDDLRSYRQCHFFAGIGGWSYALRLAGWDDERAVWTGSCPCQPFSNAGKGTGGKDERHLWPHWFRLIRECKPAVVFGENVEAAIGWGWLDAVLGDLEAEGYATGATVLGAHSVSAPHIRQRLWWVADATVFGGSAGTTEVRRQTWSHNPRSSTGMGDADQSRPQGRSLDAGEYAGQRATGTAGAWNDLEWLPCTDGKARPAKPGLQCLVDGSAFRLGSGSPFEGKSRVNMLRAYGNAIVPQVAAAFIAAYLDTLPD